MRLVHLAQLSATVGEAPSCAAIVRRRPSRGRGAARDSTSRPRGRRRHAVAMRRGRHPRTPEAERAAPAPASFTVVAADERVWTHCPAQRCVHRQRAAAAGPTRGRRPSGCRRGARRPPRQTCRPGYRCRRDARRDLTRARVEAAPRRASANASSSPPAVCTTDGIRKHGPRSSSSGQKTRWPLRSRWRTGRTHKRRPTDPEIGTALRRPVSSMESAARSAGPGTAAAGRRGAVAGRSIRHPRGPAAASSLGRGACHLERRASCWQSRSRGSRKCRASARPGRTCGTSCSHASAVRTK